MVKGLKVFQEFFAKFADQYVLIGGTAATLAMESAGLEFRATKDLDIVLHVEALSPAFGSAFWEFVVRGGYKIRQKSASKQPILYRFQQPVDPTYPAMLELFCRLPEGMRLPEGAEITPIPFDEAVSSLSAILLDNEYYAFVLEGRRDREGLGWVGEDRLIPLKASAWLDLRDRKARGEAIDAKNIRKHANDVIRLSQLLTPDTRVQLPARIRADVNRFLDAVAADGTYEPEAIGVEAPLEEILRRVAQAYL
jgi:hypothetical protein